ncbi:alpha-(1-_3)-fucosyltransferase activity protein [Tritrichomonas musculus]|uniref:Fucosyltransferase n=1 Tax=Tritrichomonas musculus TaxID=1915356 RepID=A0ABR2L4V2_9EUKA
MRLQSIRSRQLKTTRNNVIHVRIISIILQILFFFLGIFLYLTNLNQPIFLQNHNIDKKSLERQKNLSKPKPVINRSKIYYVYHSGSSYIDPVDPKGERCLIPWDYTRDITKAQLIIYNALDNYGNINSPRNPKLRPDQITCVESMESSTNYPAIFSNRKSFNYSMSYSLTSDVPIPYSEFFETNEMPLNISEKKGRLVCAFISNCHATNGRKQYVEELMKYIKIDSYGSCLNNAKVPSELEKHDKYRTKENVVKYYKFTIAFENSNDPDYVSEKLFQPLRYGSVPIFRGCSNLEDFAPRHSSIDANKFASAKELADYLIYLDNNDTAYNEYFDWKVKNDTWPLPRIRFFRDRHEYSVCALVERIHGLWINPYLTGDWKRITPDEEPSCNKCLEDFDLENRRIPVLREDNQSYDYPIGEYWSSILNISQNIVRSIVADHVNETVVQNLNINFSIINKFFSLFQPFV